MTKYGRTPRFGYSVRPTATDPTRPVRLARLAETLGLDYIGVQNGEPGADHHDSWTLLTAIGAATSRITLIAKGQDLLLHTPPMAAKVAASLDLLTNGRVEITLGKNCFMDTCTVRTAADDSESEEVALAVLEEAISLMRLVWSGDPLETFEGKFFSRSDVESTLIPARRIGIWMDANDAPALGLAGRSADGWIPHSYPSIGPSDLAALSKQLNDSATSAKRELMDIQRIWYISGYIESEESEPDHTPFHGSAKQWAESLSELALEVGIDTFILMEGEDAEAQLEKFALEVVPMVRERVELSPGVTIITGLSRAYQGAAASGPTRAEEATDDLDWVDTTSMESFPASDPPASSSFT